MPPKIALKKILKYASQRALDRIFRIKFKTFGADISAREFARALRKNVQESLKSFRERTNLFLPQQPSITDVQSVLSPEACQCIITGADRIYGHRFDLLGSGETYLGVDIDWHTDFKTGYRWNSRTYYKDIAIPYGKGDIKVPWELSRFQHLVLLGQAYWITGNEKYALEFKTQVTGWISKNPPQFGPNWACTMDVAIRAANWLVGWEFFRKSPSLNEDFCHAFLQSLLVHARFIRSNLECSDELTSNHYLSNISSLFFIAYMAPEFKESEEWFSFAHKELESEYKKQVYPDGTDFEASTCYHRLALELLLYPALLGKKNGISFSKDYNERLKKMFEAVFYLIKPNGRMPQVGDNDSGRFLKFELPDTVVLDMRYLLPLAAMYFDDLGFKILYGDNPPILPLEKGGTEGFEGFLNEIKEELLDCLFPIFWLFGTEGVKRWQGMSGKRVENLESRAFPDAGWYVMRHNRDYILISCGPNGQNGNGGHAHNDKLSFELCINGKDIIIDPGTYLYTLVPDWRNTFRSTVYHNTVSVDRMEQNRWMDGRSGLFQMSEEAKARCLEWIPGRVFIGEHYGFPGIIHRREIRFERDGWFILDKLIGEKKEGKAHFIFSPECNIVKKGENSYTIDNVILTFSKAKDKISDLWYSKEYGVKVSTKALEFIFSGELEVWIEKKSS